MLGVSGGFLGSKGCLVWMDNLDSFELFQERGLVDGKLLST